MYISTAFAVVLGLVASVSAIPANVAEHSAASVQRRATLDYTDVNCNTVCGGRGDSGPNEYDCSEIIQGLWNAGTQKFTVPAGKSQTMRGSPTNSCLIVFYNPSAYDVIYQYNDFGSVADWLRQRCNGAHGADWGACTFSDNIDPSPYINLRHA